MVDCQLGLLYMRAEENRVVMNISYIMPNPQKKYNECKPFKKQNKYGTGKKQ